MSDSSLDENNAGEALAALAAEHARHLGLDLEVLTALSFPEFERLNSYLHAMHKARLLQLQAKIIREDAVAAACAPYLEGEVTVGEALCETFGYTLSEAMLCLLERESGQRTPLAAPGVH